MGRAMPSNELEMARTALSLSSSNQTAGRGIGEISRVVARRGPSSLDWASLAEGAEQRLNGKPGPERPRELLRLAGEWEVSPGYLKKALGHLNLSREPGFSDLIKIPALVADIVRRWKDYDPAAASDALGRFVARKITKAELAKEEADARGGQVSGGVSLANQFRRFVLDKVRSENPDSSLVDRAVAGEAQFTLRKRDGVTLGVFVSGPYTDAALESRRVSEILLQALGMTFVVDEVMLACASQAAEQSALDYLRENSIVARVDVRCFDKADCLRPLSSSDQPLEVAAE